MVRCDLCGRLDSESNSCCPQHEAWRLQEELDSRDIEIKLLHKLLDRYMEGELVE